MKEKIVGISCNRIYQRYRARKPVDMGRYASGPKRSNSCDVFMNWDGSNCPCCGMSLRTRPRTAKSKRIFRQPQTQKIG